MISNEYYLASSNNKVRLYQLQTLILNLNA